MWNWIKELLFEPQRPQQPKLARQPRLLKADKLHVTVVTVDGREFKRTFVSRYLGAHPFSGEDWIQTSSERFDLWRERCAELGSVTVQNDKFIPLCNIKEFNTVSEEMVLEVAR